MVNLKNLWRMSMVCSNSWLNLRNFNIISRNLLPQFVFDDILNLVLSFVIKELFLEQILIHHVFRLWFQSFSNDCRLRLK